MKKLALVIFFLLIAVWIYASDSNVERLSLKGLKGLEVVSHLQSNVSLPGFKEGQLQGDIENKLKRAGIKIPFKVEYDENPLDYGLLHVRVVIVYHETADFYFYTNNLEIMQYCVLSRDRNYETMMPTWSEGFSGGNTSIQQIRAKILENIDMVIKAYFSVNPYK
ncbi:MAG: hypothetical protein JSV25_04725 [Spirochaetota bacterium]|nr:MAG: hypothetical protein JSV25_04725 [Spirochaetota bacterium]